MEGLVRAPRENERHPTLETTRAFMAMLACASRIASHVGNRTAGPNRLPTRRPTQQEDPTNEQDEKPTKVIDFRHGKNDFDAYMHRRNKKGNNHGDERE